MSRELEELKEMKAICYAIIKRIDVLEEASRERQRSWCLEMNKRLNELGIGYKDSEEQDES